MLPGWSSWNGVALWQSRYDVSVKMWFFIPEDGKIQPSSVCDFFDRSSRALHIQCKGFGECRRQGGKVLMMFSQRKQTAARKARIVVESEGRNSKVNYRYPQTEPTRFANVFVQPQNKPLDCSPRTLRCSRALSTPVPKLLSARFPTTTSACF